MKLKKMKMNNMGAVNDILEKIVPLAQNYIEEEGLGLRESIDKAIDSLGYRSNGNNKEV